MLDFLVLYESLLDTWTSYPFVLHALAVDEPAAERLGGLGLDRLEVHRPGEPGPEPCIATDAGNVFLAEVPELWFLLGSHDASAEALPPAYSVDAGAEGLTIERDQLGFIEERAGRIKVLHLGALSDRGAHSLADRIDVLVERFPRLAPLMSHYVGLASRGAERLGLDVVPNPERYLRDRLLEAGILPTRNQLADFLNRRGLGGTGVEVGVKRGVFSEAILRGWHGRLLISVDPWSEAAADEYVDVANVPQADHDRFHEETLGRLEAFGERSAVWRMTSTEAAARVDPGSLDFVYLDARHDYGSVSEDLERWFDRIRPGGVFTGHDYFDGLVPEGLFGVRSAVDEFFGARGLPVKPTYAHMRGGHPPSWLVEIPT